MTSLARQIIVPAIGALVVTPAASAVDLSDAESARISI